MTGKVHHWKHGWIPLDAYARAIVASKQKKNPPTFALRTSPVNQAQAKDLAGGKAALARLKKNQRGGAMLNALKTDGGFTYNPKKGTLVKVGSVDGVAVARPGTENIVGRGDVSREDFANAVADVIEAHGDEFSKGAMLGGWYSEDRDVYMVEITDVFPDRASAVKAGRERNQEGVFDLKTGDFIDTGGTGDQHMTMAVSMPPDVVLNHPFVDPVPNNESSFSAAADTTEQLVAPSTGPGQKFWPAGVPAIKDVGIFNAADGARLAQAWEASGQVIDKYTALEPKITPGLVGMAARNGGHMQGLKHKLKTRDSLTRKLFSKSVQKRMTPQQYAATIGDALRYTMVAEPGDLASGTQKVLDDYRKRGFTVQVENTWGIPEATYRGINTNITKDGRTFEVQFHTQQSFDVKMSQHDLYDIARSTAASPEARAAANAQMEANMATLVFPPGIENVR